MFKRELPDYDIMVLQSVSFDAALKNNIQVPLILNFCMPDSDYCYFFSIKVENKQLKTEMIDEQEFREFE
jgi:predicted proteasome-type protease